jgi:hypothetical protein
LKFSREMSHVQLDKVASNQNKELNVETLCFLKVD